MNVIDIIVGGAVFLVKVVFWFSVGMVALGVVRWFLL